MCSIVVLADRRLLSWDWREGRSEEVGRTQGTPWALWVDRNGLFSADGAKQVLWWSAQGPRLLGSTAGKFVVWRLPQGVWRPPVKTARYACTAFPKTDGGFCFRKNLSKERFF